MQAARKAALLLAVVSGIPLVGACGPSLELQHENNLRFEHCYRLDADPEIAPTHREYCWKDWTAHYATEQPLDRVEYARRRITALDSGDTRTVLLHPGRRPARVFEDLGSGETEPMAAPVPTSPHAPPPTVEPVPTAPAADTEDARPGATCSTACATDLDKCDGLCRTKHADCAACREDYRRCMRRCFD